MLTVLAEQPGSTDTRSSSARASRSALSVPSRVKSLVHNSAFKRLRELLDGDQLDTEPPRLALAEMALSVERPSWRAAAIKTLLVHQPDLWSAVWASSAEDWDDEHWRIALQAVLAVAGELDGSGLSDFVAKAPPACSDLCMAVALRFAKEERQPLTQAAMNVLRARVEQITEADEGELTASSAALHWPEAPDAAEQTVLQALLTAIPREQRPTVVVEALRDGKVDPSMAAGLLDSEGIEAGLTAAQGAEKEQLVRACYEHDPDTTVSAVETLQGEDFSLELVTGLAASDPDTAFSAAEAAWDDLAATTKDALVDLLDEHATRAQSGLLDKISGDTVKPNQPDGDERSPGSPHWQRGGRYPPASSRCCKRATPRTER